MYNNYGKNNGNYGNKNFGNQGQQGNNKQKQSDGGIWLAVSRKGQQYFRIKIGDQWYSAFANNYKENNPKAPDYIILKSDMNFNGNGATQNTNQNNNYAGNNNFGNNKTIPANNYGNNGNNYGAQPSTPYSNYGTQSTQNNNIVNNNVNEEDIKNAYYDAYSKQAKAQFEEVDSIPDLPTSETSFPQF